VNCIRRILVAVKDPLARSLPAVTKATQLARALGAELELFHAVDSAVYVDMMAMEAGSAQRVAYDEREQCIQRLERIAARARLHTSKVSVVAEWDYPVYEAIVRRAIRSGADLVIAERHAGRHVAPGLLKLADWELLRLSPVPVLLVRRAQPYHRPTILTALDPSRAFAKPANLDREILRLGNLVVNGLRGQLHAVHACLPRLTRKRASSAAAEAKVRLDEVLEASRVSPERRHLVTGRPSDSVLDVAGRLHADIVVAGAISRSGLMRLLSGNTAEELLNRLPCDLLIVKPGGFVNRVPSGIRGPHWVAVEPAG
jgi:universal stress protein E